MNNAFGPLIATARESVGMTVEQLADRIGQSVSTVRRLEAGRGGLTIEQCNALVSVLPLSADALLHAAGANLNPPAAARLPRALVLALLDLDTADLVAIERTARALSAYRPQERRAAQR